MTESEHIRPTNSKLLVEIDDDIQTLPSGIVLGYGLIEREQVLWGTILAVGPGMLLTKGPRAGTREPLPVRVGDRVAVRRSSGYVELHEDGRELVIVDWYTQVFCARPGPMEGPLNEA